jgi:hypothetical protein
MTKKMCGSFAEPDSAHVSKSAGLLTKAGKAGLIRREPVPAETMGMTVSATASNREIETSVLLLFRKSFVSISYAFRDVFLVPCLFDSDEFY